jgi:hypothetical protein
LTCPLERTTLQQPYNSEQSERSVLGCSRKELITDAAHITFGDVIHDVCATLSPIIVTKLSLRLVVESASLKKHTMAINRDHEAH